MSTLAFCRVAIWSAISCRISAFSASRAACALACSLRQGYFFASLVPNFVRAPEAATPTPAPAAAPPMGVATMETPQPTAAVQIVAVDVAANNLSFLILQFPQPVVALSAVPVTSLPSLTDGRGNNGD